jgi:hypothetical protein
MYVGQSAAGAAVDEIAAIKSAREKAGAVFRQRKSDFVQFLCKTVLNSMLHLL